ncbi:MAG: hypothetical protein ACW97P_02545 [Candidatus Hodarchaeales archaeon]|jgi:hypothetical protein
MSVGSIMNTYCRRYAPIVMIILPAIIVLMIINEQSNEIAALLWFFLFINSIAFLLNALNIIKGFNRETAKKAESGFPIDSLEGFSSVKSFNTQVFLNSSLITGAIFLSFIFYILAAIILPELQQADAQNLSGIDKIINDLVTILEPTILWSALGLVLIAIGMWLLLKIPDKPAFQPGAMLKYYKPKSVPMTLDNLLSDAMLSFLDPITRIKMDEWTESIRTSLNPLFESLQDETTRLERAREKILLLFYLKERVSTLLTEEIFLEELGEVIQIDRISDFLEGKESGIDSNIIEDVFARLETQIPEVFKVIDRLLIDLVDNLKSFRDNKDMWVSVSTPDIVYGNQDPFRILIFTLNKDKTKSKRLITFNATGVRSGFMEEQKFNLVLDDAEDFNITTDKISFTSSETTDILTLLSQILQVGDAVWFSFERRAFKNHLFNVFLTEENSGIYSKTTSVTVSRDFMFYISEYGGRASALGGVVVPVISFLFSFLGF